MDPKTQSDPIQDHGDSPISSGEEFYLQACVLLFTALVYIGSVRFDFVYDDHAQIVQNALVHSWRFVPQYFQGHVWEYLYPGAPGNYYRPLNVLWFRLNDALFALQAPGWHLFAILLHTLATFLAYRVARTLTGRPFVAAFAALVFGVHPMRHEVVAWVSGTTESLWSVFFGAFLAYLKSRENRRMKWMAISCALFAAALLSKETAIMFPAVIFAHAWFYGGQPAAENSASFAKRAWQASVPVLAYLPLAIGYVIVRVIELHGFSHPVEQVSLGSVLLAAPSIALFYAKQWLIPIQNAEFYDLPMQANFDFAHVLLPALALLVIIIGLWAIRKKLGSREVGFSAVWMIVLLLPAFDVAIFPTGQLVHDRYFYLPSFGAALIAAVAMAKLANGAKVYGLPQKWLLPTLAVMALLAFSTAYASRFWKNDYTMFEHGYRVAPQNWWARNGYASESAKGGNYDIAVPMLEQLLKEDPNGWLANFNYGRINYEVGLFPQADHYLRRAIQISPTMPDSYLVLALMELRIGRLDQAEQNMRQAVALRPIEASYRFALGTVLAERKDCTDAIAEFRETLNLQRDFPKTQAQINKCSSPATENAVPAPGIAAEPAPTIAPTPASIKSAVTNKN